MSNPSKQKGSAFETAVVGYLNDHGFPMAERRVTNGAFDRGDVGGIPSVVLEAKAEMKIALSEYMKELSVEMGNAQATWGAAVVKKRNGNVADAYAVMPFSLFVFMLRHLPPGRPPELDDE